jgi:multidrug efflux system membrane fusion protein
MRTFAKPLFPILAFCCLNVLYGCKEVKKEPVHEVAVTVTLPAENEVTSYLEFTGTTQAVQYVDIRARVAGFLQKIHFEPDARVKTGDLLFTIDPSQYQAAVDENKAQLESTKAKYRLAKTEEEAAKGLQLQQAISALKLEEKVATSSVAKADIDLAQASLEKAELNLLWTQVTSPIDGRVSRNLVDEGNLVGATEKTLLTTVVNDESMYCYFNISQSDILKLRQKYAPPKDERDVTVKSLKIPAQMGLSEESGYSHEGYVDYADTKLNPSTGTDQVRAVFPNPDGLLLAGMFARIRVPIETKKSLIIPGVAVQFDQGGNYVLTVSDKNVVQQKRVKLGSEVAENTVIEEGLTPKDRVIILGVQRAKPGAKVKPTMSPASQSGGAASKPGQGK